MRPITQPLTPASWQKLIQTSTLIIDQNQQWIEQINKSTELTDSVAAELTTGIAHYVDARKSLIETVKHYQTLPAPTKHKTLIRRKIEQLTALIVENHLSYCAQLNRLLPMYGVTLITLFPGYNNQ